jgi:ketosteroid isomerase-like protein
MTDARLARVRAFFESIGPADVARLDEIYTPDAWFKDPFNEVRGTEAIARIFTHMFEALDAPRFVVRDAAAVGDQAFLTWDFRFRMRRLRDIEQVIHGASHLRFGPDGRVSYHRDYWDAAEELYEKLPLVGGLMRWLKRRVAA